jgi:hypothetical protein
LKAAAAWLRRQALTPEADVCYKTKRNICKGKLYYFPPQGLFSAHEIGNAMCAHSGSPEADAGRGAGPEVFFCARAFVEAAGRA